MRIRDILRQEKSIPKLDLLAILSHTLSTTTEHLLSSSEHLLCDAEMQHIQACVAERRKGKPLAYITNRKEFFSEPFFVDEHVLIPRPETELLVEEALRIMKAWGRTRSVMDMGTGSGALAVLLAKGGAEQVISVDISTEALAVARRNAADHGVSERVHFVCSDLFGGIKEGRTFDLILANLPYIPEPDWQELMVDVRAFEPKRALVAGSDGCEIYRRFAGRVAAHLMEDGCLLCEVGDNEQADIVARLLTGIGLMVAFRKDLAGRERMLLGSWTSLS